MFASSRNINDLHPRLREIFVRFDAAMKKAGIDFIVTCTYRNNADQDALFAQGRITSGHVVTNAKAGQSKHNGVNIDGKPASTAFDIVIISNGKADWNVGNPAWKIAGRLGKSVGLEWAGDWKSFKEYPHFQLKEE
jgi:peptidoglycan L-alanyl-D-glutamate endopeptidase CwlK